MFHNFHFFSNQLRKYLIWCPLTWHFQKCKIFCCTASLMGPSKDPHFIKGSTKGKILRFTNLVFFYSSVIRNGKSCIYLQNSDQRGQFDTYNAILWYYHMTFYDRHKCHKMSFYDIYDGHKVSKKYGNMGIKLTVLISLLQINTK